MQQIPQPAMSHARHLEIAAAYFKKRGLVPAQGSEVDMLAFFGEQVRQMISRNRDSESSWIVRDLADWLRLSYSEAVWLYENVKGCRSSARQLLAS